MSAPEKGLRRWMRILSPSCQEASRLQSRALDEPLGRAENLGLRVHLVLCRWCRRYGRQLVQLREAARRHPDHPDASLPTSLPPEGAQRLKERLRRPQD